MPISTPVDLASDYGGDPHHFDHVLRYLFEPALERAGYDLVPPGVSNSQIIQAEIIRNLETADLVLCDISKWNANVFFELGIRVALDRPVALVKDDRTPIIPFDNALVSCHTYDASITPWCLRAEIEGLAEFVQTAGAQERNALWQYFGITQRASVSAAGDPVQEKLDLILASLQRPNQPTYGVSADAEFIPLLAELTAREYTIFGMLATGASVASIASDLMISAGAVERYLHNIYTKLGVTSRVQAALLAQRMIMSGNSPFADSEE